MKYDVIIIGAGAAGLSAMREIVKQGYYVCLLEASGIAGGRIATIKEGFTKPVETGAEFIHGEQKLTLKLLKEAGITYEAVEGEMIGVQNGEWQKEEHDEHWNNFMRKLHKLKTDVTILQFLDEHFKEDKYKGLRQSVQRFAEGFDLADISRASMISLKNEWKNIEKTQYRIKGGYIQLIDHLLKCSLQKNGVIYYNSPVNKIEYKANNVIVHTTDKRKFEAKKLIITASVGVLQYGNIQFDPVLTDHAIALQSLGYGTVIKFLLEFKTDFWAEYGNDIGFLLTDEKIPTWWTQLPDKSNLLTGWLGGPKTGEKVFESEGSLLNIAINSLSSIFHITTEELRKNLIHHKIIRWQDHPYIKGGYSYNTLASDQARNIFSRPIDNTIFFAGEAYAQSDSPGTVESALQSAYDTSMTLINSFTDKKIDHSSSWSGKL
jgi:monoamine oxidase